ncbi:hypothetical protein U3516DRAFT_763390 [Neocallimastix sp. 'constans']
MLHFANAFRNREFSNNTFSSRKLTHMEREGKLPDRVYYSSNNNNKFYLLSREPTLKGIISLYSLIRLRSFSADLKLYAVASFVLKSHSPTLVTSHLTISQLCIL